MGGARHFHLGGPLEGPVLQQGELSMVCVGLQCNDMTSRGKFLGGSGPPWHPPSSAPGCCYSDEQGLKNFDFPGKVVEISSRPQVEDYRPL